MIMQGINGMSIKDAAYHSLSFADKKAYRDRQAKVLLRKVESGWQEFVAEVKSTIVLKTMVLPFNIMSNTIFSFMYGMPLDYMMKKQSEAVISLQDYTEKLRRRTILQQRLGGIGITKEQTKKLEGEINQLTFDIDNNPIKSLVDIGMINSIVEDISLEQDQDAYSMRGKLANYLEGKISKVPGGVRTAYNWAQLGKDTQAYKLLETATRYSDFVARYAMFEFLTREKSMSPNEALEEVMSAFVEYDPPTSKELQYLNEIGLAMFTKYAIRIQKVIAKLFLEKPETAVGLYLLEQQFGMRVPDPSDVFLSPNWNYAWKDLSVIAMPGVQAADGYADLLLPDVLY
jgi:hypothetical protein